MEAAKERGAPPPSHEVIVISDDESDSVVKTSSSSRHSLELSSWSDVAERLLMLAKHSNLRADQQFVKALLGDLGIPSSVNVRHCLRVVCERLEELLLLSRGHERRHRACEDLAVVVCEVLSLAQTAPVRVQEEYVQVQVQVKEERREGVHMFDLLQLMEKWNWMLAECSRTSLGRERAFNAAISRLEGLKSSCTDEVVRLHDCIAEQETEKENTAKQWEDVLERCRSVLQLVSLKDHLEPGNSDILAFESTLEMTENVREKFYEHNHARIALVRQEKEMAMRRDFYSATLELAYAMIGLAGSGTQEDQDGCATFTLLENDILGRMDNFCGGLHNVTRSNQPCAQLAFANQLKLFWLIRRNWLSPVVLDVVSARFDTLFGANVQSECPVCTAVAQVCAGLKAGYLKQ